MEPPSSIPTRTSGIPRPTSRLPVLRSSSSQPQLRQPSSASTEQLRRKASNTSLSKPNQIAPALQKKTSRTSLARTTTPSTAASDTSSTRASLTSTTRRTVPSGAQTRSLNNDGAVFKKPIGRPPSRQTRTRPQTTAAASNINLGEDGLGDLEGFRSSSRAGCRENESEYVLESDTEPINTLPRKSRPSLSDRTIKSLSHLPSSPAGKGRRRSSFFSPDNSMPPPIRPASALGNNNGRPMTSDGTPRARPATPSRLGAPSQRGSMTAPGKRSVSAALPNNPIATPSKTLSVSRPGSQLRKQPLSQMQSIQATPKPRPLSNSKTMTARTPKARPSLAGVFGEAVSPPTTVVPLTPSPSREHAVVNKTPDSSRRVSNSSAALREQIAKAKAARRAGATGHTVETPRKISNSSGALREQIAKAKEAARRANTAKNAGGRSPPREVPAVTENEFGIVPDPAEIAGFDFGLDDPFNQRPKGSKSLLQKRVDSARLDGRLNIAAMGLKEIPDEILGMYKYDPNNSSIAWGEVVDLTSIIAADNELERLPDELFPDVDIDAVVDSDDTGPEFVGLQNFDLHGNVLRDLPVGLRRLSQLSKLNLSRNQLNNNAFDVISQITTLRELRLAENALQGVLPGTLGSLGQLEILELQGNKLNGLPPEIRELVHLRTLNVSDNQLRSLPSELFTSVPIIELLASKNAFSGAFFNVDTVPHLQNLQLSNNSISSVCETGTVLLPALKTLDMSVNRLSSLPDISCWTSLVTLLVGENKISSVPEGFLSLQQLRTADFTANDLTKLDERIALMDGLENLTVAANPLRDRKFLTMNTEDIKRNLQSRLAPSGVDDAQDEGAAHGAGNTSETHGLESDWRLKPSGSLDLSFKDLTELDKDALSSFAEANDVRQLYLQQNYLSAIPSAISQFTHLTVLDLSKNSIPNPVTESLRLSKLRELRLASNKIQSFNEWVSLLSAPSLQHLDVTNNRISGPLPILREVFPELLLLMASNNAISEVSAESLDGLKMVNLSNNEIPRLEPRIGLLAGTLTSLDVEGNKFRVPNYAILQKGTDALLTWLRGKIPSPTQEEF
ncbi:L domain-like protein [Zopfia rhizophila CBS 207.26]|uniref:L domain-like protein n=1 Tax=Zopfia rhizophila CBS 207.26 TaxID=1314779 RepID=A0A6A6EJU0_9PEZI|nr:L domain-like protein [Zopfia rhizophila CBS 207.26]